MGLENHQLDFPPVFVCPKMTSKTDVELRKDIEKGRDFVEIAFECVAISTSGDRGLLWLAPI